MIPSCWDSDRPPRDFSTFHDPRQILCKVRGLISINGGWSFPYISISFHLRSDRFLSSGYFRLGSCRPNLSRFWAVNNLTELLKKSKNLLRFCSPRQWPPTNKILTFFSSRYWDNEASSAPILGWGLNSSRFGHFVPGCTNFLQSFLGYETGTKDIRLNRGSYGSPTWFSME